MNNFRSYKNEGTLSLEAGSRLRKYNDTNIIDDSNEYKLLKNVNIFGANGSGKSSILNGIRIMKNMVIQTTDDVNEKLPYFPFKLDEKSVKRLTDFEIIFTTNNKIYNYSFSYNEREIVKERLLVKETSKFKTIFKRNEGVIKFNSKRNSSVKNVRPNKLILYSLQDINDIYAVDVFKWFTNDLQIFNRNALPDFDVFDHPLYESEDVKKELHNFLRAADINIDGLIYRDVKTEIPEALFNFLKSTAPEEIREKISTNIANERQVFTIHKKYDEDGNNVDIQELPLTEESTGTIRVVTIALAIIASQLSGNNKTILFDEFEEGLHTEISQALINIFNSVQNKNQFILTTHDVNILDTNIRVDQIYLAEKNHEGESELYSLFDFDSKDIARTDYKFSKRYIKGQFGAVPVINIQALENSFLNIEGHDND